MSLLAGAARVAGRALGGAVAHVVNGGAPPNARKDIYQFIGKWDLLQRTLSTLDSSLPGWTHAIHVAVRGGPKSSIRRLWYLCLSAAFGRYRERVSFAVADVSLQAQWDITNKIVALEMTYSGSGWTTAGKLVNAGAVTLPSYLPLARLARGPEQLTIGGSWPNDLIPPTNTNPDGWTTPVNMPSWTVYAPCPDGTYTTQSTLPFSGIGGGRNIGTGQIQSGVSVSTLAANTLVEYPYFGQNSQDPAYSAASVYPWFGTGPLIGGSIFPQGYAPDYGCNVSVIANQVHLPTLPDDGRIITTHESNDPATQPPRPIIDGQTRSGLLSLVAQSLNTPCFLPFSAPCTQTPLACSGRYLYNPGADTGSDATTQGKISQQKTSFDVPIPSTYGPDGYQTQPPNGQMTNDGGK